MPRDLSAHERRLEWVDSDTPRDNAVRWCALRRRANSILADTFPKYFSAETKIFNQTVISTILIFLFLPLKIFC